LKQLKIDLKHE